MYSIILIVFAALLLTQILLAVLSKLRGWRLHKKFNHALSSQVTLAGLLEKYSRLEKNLSITVNAAIASPAQAYGEVVLVNRSWVYKPELFPNFYGLWQLVLTSQKYVILKRLHTIQIFIYLAQLLLLILSLVVWEVLIWPSLVLGLIAIIYSLYVESVYEKSLQKTYTLALDYLELDRIEQSRGLKLLDRLRGVGFEYALQPFTFILRFLGIKI